MESRGRGSLSRCGQRAARGGGAAAGAPLYERLPHGPHRLERSEVVRHQRLRIHGAMVETVAERGYAGTSVKRVVALAGVSRRSFYEQFANKRECFLATFDLIAKRELQRAAAACRDSDGPRERRLLAALTRLAESARSEPKVAGLVLIEVQTAGAAGTQRLQGAIAGGEQLLRAGLAAEKLPAPIVGAIAGGVHGVLAARLRGGAQIDSAGLGAELLDWTLLLEPAGAGRLREQLASRFARRMRELSRASARRAGVPALHGQARERMLQSALRVNALDGYANLSPARIADAAGVSSDHVLASFADGEACLLAALEMLGEELCALAAAPAESSSEWPRAVRLALGRLLGRLAERPVYARTIAQAAFCASPEAIARNVAIAPALAERLTAAAPTPAQAHSGLAVEAIAGALSHVLRCQVAGARVALLPALADHLAYVVLAPFIGPDAAVAALADDLRA